MVSLCFRFQIEKLRDIHIPPKNKNDINIFLNETTKNESPIIEIVDIAIEMQ